MANTQAMCTSFKAELLNAVHQFGSPTIVSRTSLTAPTADSMKAALYYSTASLGAGTTVYTTTGEVLSTDTPNANYTAGGMGVGAWNAPTTGGVVGYSTPTTNLVWTNITISSTSFDAVLIYNSTQGNKAVSVHTFGAQTITAGELTLTMPSNSSTTALLRLA